MIFAGYLQRKNRTSQHWTKKIRFQLRMLWTRSEGTPSRTTQFSTSMDGTLRRSPACCRTHWVTINKGETETLLPPELQKARVLACPSTFRLQPDLPGVFRRHESSRCSWTWCCDSWLRICAQTLRACGRLAGDCWLSWFPCFCFWQPTFIKSSNFLLTCIYEQSFKHLCNTALFPEDSNHRIHGWQGSKVHWKAGGVGSGLWILRERPSALGSTPRKGLKMFGPCCLMPTHM